MLPLQRSSPATIHVLSAQGHVPRANRSGAQAECGMCRRSAIIKFLPLNGPTETNPGALLVHLLVVVELRG